MQKLRMSVLQKISALLANFIDVLLKKFKGKKNILQIEVSKLLF